MQSIALFGRQIARAFITSIQSEFRPNARPREPLHLVTGTAGFSKSLTKNQAFKKWTFGDDAYFIARNKVADVIDYKFCQCNKFPPAVLKPDDTTLNDGKSVHVNIFTHSKTERQKFGVADGVGGWRNYGIDPSAFPRSLMELCQRLVVENQFKPQAPASIIEDGYCELLQQKTPLIGSSTACIVALHKEERTIYTANLGDSGFLVIRDGEVVHRSQEQQHYFNTPFQLAVAPPSQEWQVLSDSPSMAQSTSYRVEEGDVILLGTDGLFDNLSEDMIVDYITRMKDKREENVQVQTTAKNIAEKAHQLSFDPDYLSPFALSALDAGIAMRGGKPDDITVILAKVSCQPEET